MKKLNISKAVVSRGASLLVVSIALVAAYVAISMNMTLGWFAKNNTVTASGMVTQAYDANFKITYQSVEVTTKDGSLIITPKNELVDSPGDFLAAVKVPGQSVAFNVTITNVGAYPAKVTGIGLKAPSADDDRPLIETVTTDGTTSTVYYYLSTQLTTEILAASVTNPDYEIDIKDLTPGNDTDDNAKPLRTEASGAQAINYFDWLICTIVDSSENEDSTEESETPAVTTDVIILDKGQSITLTIQMTFKDSDQDQNVYKNYYEKGGTCIRDIFITYE